MPKNRNRHTACGVILLYCDGPQRVRWSLVGLLVAACLLTACQKKDLGPVEIAPEDMCAYCRMAISEKRYATQFISLDGEPFTFDDIGCMRNFIEDRQNRDQVAAYFVVDFDSRQWIKAEDAYYVSSEELKSPMRGNTAAFKEEATAQQAVSKFQGKLLRFNDLDRP